MCIDLRFLAEASLMLSPQAVVFLVACVGEQYGLTAAVLSCMFCFHGQLGVKTAMTTKPEIYHNDPPHHVDVVDSFCPTYEQSLFCQMRRGYE